MDGGTDGLTASPLVSPFTAKHGKGRGIWCSAPNCGSAAGDALNLDERGNTAHPHSLVLGHLRVSPRYRRGTQDGEDSAGDHVTPFMLYLGPLGLGAASKNPYPHPRPGTRRRKQQGEDWRRKLRANV